MVPTLGPCTIAFFVNRLAVISGVKKQLLQELSKMGLVDRGSRGDHYGQGVNTHAENAAIRGGVFFTGTASNIAWSPRTRFDKGYRTTRDDKVTLAIGSMNNPKYSSGMQQNVPEGNYFKRDWFTFSEMILNNQKELRETTAVSRTEVLLFGGNKLEPTDETEDLCGRLDDWILARGEQKNFDHLHTLRSGLNCVMLDIVAKPSQKRKERQQPTTPPPTLSTPEGDPIDPVLARLQNWKSAPHTPSVTSIGDGASPSPNSAIDESSQNNVVHELVQAIDESFQNNVVNELVRVLEDANKYRRK